MSYECGRAALHLEMPDRVPRTEFSLAEYHFPLISRATGLNVNVDSTDSEKAAARRALREAWTFDFNWNILIGGGELGDCRTSMGHAVYAEQGRDFNDNLTQLYADPEDALSFDPWEMLGRKSESELRRRFEENYRAQRETLPNEVPMTGTYITLMSGLIDLFGWDTLLTACGMDPTGFGEVANRYAAWMQQYMNALAESDLEYVMIHDDIVWTEGAFLHPEWYRKYIFPNYKKYFAPIKESGKKLLFTSDGTFTEFIDDLVDVGVDCFVMEPTTDMKYIAERYGKTHSFVGNADTRILLFGGREEIEAEVKRCMDIGKSCPGFIMAVGNHIPSNTPVENCLIYEEAYRKMCRR